MQIAKEIHSFPIEANAQSATGIRAVEKESIASRNTAGSTSQQFSQPPLTAGRIEISDPAETGLASPPVYRTFSFPMIVLYVPALALARRAAYQPPPAPVLTLPLPPAVMRGLGGRRCSPHKGGQRGNAGKPAGAVRRIDK